MAALAITAAQAELISSLSQDEIPIKLRCAICSRLAINAFRLPCCDQAICENCQSTLPNTCPVCEHTPVAGEDCKPNKSLRTTIKVFLRTEEKKREALRLKEEKNTSPDTPLAVEPTPLEHVAAIEKPTPTNEITGFGEGMDENAQPSEEALEAVPPVTLHPEQTAQAEQDIPHQSIEEIAPGQESTSDADANSGEDKAQKGEGIAEKDENGQSDVPQTPGFGAGFGFDPGANGGFPGMGFGGDFNQMQMMMAMQNGMAGAGGFGNFPMMGMSGLMDPMAMQNMQNMFVSGGFGAGVNNMNTGAGMGFEGGIGTGFNNGWNGQSWNVGNNFNPNATASIMGHGDYGANNSGYASHPAGFNQGNYGRGNHYNDYQNSYGSQGYRGRGRGRGGHGRGGYGYGSNEVYSEQMPQQYPSNHHQQSNRARSESGSVSRTAKAEGEPAPNVDEFGRELRPDTKEDTPTVTEDKNAVKPEDSTENREAGLTTGPVAEQSESVQDSNAPMPIQTLDDVDNVNNYGLGGYGQGHFRGRGGSYSAMQPPVKPVDVPINAPTGPKAMRENLPNTSIYNMRGRGYVPGGISSRPSGSASASVVPDVSEKGDAQREQSRSPSRDAARSRSKARSRSRSHSRQRSRSRDRHHRRHRHRSTSLTEDDKETERRRERRREERERRRRRDEEEVVDDGIGEIMEKEDVPADEKSRSASPAESRSGHKSRRDKDKYRERDRDSEKDRKSHRHRSRRSHRDERERSRSRDREHRHRHSRHHSQEPQFEPQSEKVETSDDRRPEETLRKPSIIEIKGASGRRKNTLEDIQIPTGPRSDRDRIPSSALARDFKKEEKRSRDDRSSRHESSRSGRDKDRQRDRGYDREKDRDKENGRSVPTTPAKDPHELEREARNRERLLKEAQRIAGFTAAVGTKRSRDDGDEGLGGKSRRKKGRRGGVVEENEESRLARLEAERENGRWN